ncbi:MAG TPA: hypothetical protein VF135_11075 [Terriglobales bacterium]
MKNWKHKCELKLLVCQPNPLRPDRVTIGYVLRDTNPDAARVEVRFAKNLSAVRCVYPDADIEAIEGTLLEMESVLKNVTDFEQHLLHMSPEFPADFALLSGGALLTDDFEKELPLLEKQYLTRPKRTAQISELVTELSEAPTEAEPVGRPYLRRRMHEAFAQAGSANLLATDIPVSEYTFQGDLLKIDFGYRRSEAKYRMMHAASVVTGLAQTAVFALSWPSIKAGISKQLADGAEMIAIIEDSRFSQSEQARKAQQWMTDNGIEVRPVSEVALLAEEAGRELGL